MKSKLRAQILFLFFSAAAVALAIGAYQLALNSKLERETLRLKTLSDEIDASLFNAVNVFNYGLGGANGIFAASKSVEHDEFRDYVKSRNLPREFPGAKGFGFIQYVPREALPKFIQETRSDSQPDFNVLANGKSKDLFIIKFAEPEADNEQSKGYDIGTQEAIREAAELAATTGKSVLTKRIQLLQDLSKSAGFLFLKPVYRNGLPTESEDQRKAALTGWVYAAVLLDRIIQHTFEKVGSNVSIRIFEGNDRTQESLLYSSVLDTQSSPLPLQISEIEIGLKKWQVIVAASPSFFQDDAGRYMPEIAAGSVITLALLLAVGFWFLLKRNALHFATKLKEKDKFVEGILKSSISSIIVTDTKGTIKIFNEAACSMLGYSPTEMVDKATPAVFHDSKEIVSRAEEITRILGKEIEPGFEVFAAAARENLSEPSEWTYIRKNGSRLSVSLSVTTIRNETGEILAYMGMANDISDRKAWEKELQESEERFRGSFMHASHGMALVSLRGDWLKTNNALCTILGYTESELLKRTFQDITHPEDLEKDLFLLGQALAGEIDNYGLEKRYFHSSGHIVWVLLSVSIVRDANRKPLYFVSQIQDITETKKTEEDLIDRSNELSLAALASEIGVWRWDLSTTTVDWDESTCSIYGPLRSDQPGTYDEWKTRVHPEDLERVHKILVDYVNGTGGYDTEFRIFWPDGSMRYLKANGNLVFDGTGKPLRMIGTNRDITKEKLHEIALANSKEAAEKSATFKSQFLANMSHEIRTPLTSILGYSESLLSDNLAGDDQMLAIQTVRRNGEHLLGIINDILDLSKIEAGMLDTELIPVDLADLLSDVLNLMQGKANEKKLSLGFDFQYPIPRKIVTDPTRLKQILINLVGNAVKFTSVGGVKINVTYSQAEESLSFQIVDTGPGFSLEQGKKLFQAFAQADNSTTRKYGGTGLGLTISKELAQKLGGGIKAESELGKGSVFTVTIAIGEVSKNDLAFSITKSNNLSKPADAVAVPQLVGNVLVAEDGEDNQNLISFLLKKTGVNFRIVANGALAVEELQNANYSLVFMDAQMPVMDGYTATQLIRERGSKIPIIALTANAMKSDVDRAYSFGCTDFLGKPFTRVELFTKLSQYLESTTQKEIIKITKSTEKIFEVLKEFPDMIDLVITISSNLPRRLNEMRSALQSGDLEAVERFSHSLRGISGTVGFSTIAVIAGSLERAASEKNEQSVQETLDCLKDEITKIEEIVEGLQLH